MQFYFSLIQYLAKNKKFLSYITKIPCYAFLLDIIPKKDLIFYNESFKFSTCKMVSMIRKRKWYEN